MIESAMRTISFVSCIQFLEWDGEAKDYVHFQPDKKRLGWVFGVCSLNQNSSSHLKCFNRLHKSLSISGQFQFRPFYGAKQNAKMTLSQL